MELALWSALVSVLVLAVIIMAAGQRSLVRSVLDHDREIITKLLARTELQHGADLLAASRPAPAQREEPVALPPPAPRAGFVPVPPSLDGE